MQRVQASGRYIFLFLLGCRCFSDWSRRYSNARKKKLKAMHSEVTPYMYGGFRTWGDTIPATLKPG